MIYRLADFGILFFLFTLGYIISTYFQCRFNLSFNNRFKLIISFPIGTGFWALSWIILAITSYFFNLKRNDIITLLSLGIDIIIIISCIIYLIRNIVITKKILCINYFTGLLSSFLLLAVIELLDRFLIFGDSYAFTTWSYNIFDITKQGFPLFGLSLSNLSAVILPDYYFFPIHPLMSIILIFLVFESIFLNNNTKLNRSNLIFILTLICIYISNSHFVWQSMWVNFNSATAVYLVIFVHIVSFSNKENTNISLTILLLFIITVIRIEGMILSLSLILFFCYDKITDAVSRNRILFCYTIFTFIFTCFLSFSLKGSSVINSEKYLGLWAATFFLFIFDRFYIKNNFYISKRLWIIAFISLTIILVYFLIFNSEAMNISIYNYFKNLLKHSIWGLTNHVMILTVLLITIVRINQKRYFSKNDLLLYFFLFNILLSLVLSNFREPYRIGWFDSANRMYFQVFPLLVIWIGREFTFSREDKLRT